MDRRAPTQKQKENNQPATRQAGWVTARLACGKQPAGLTCPHRYGRKTKQLAIRIPKKKKKGKYTYAVLVTTNIEITLKKADDTLVDVLEPAMPYIPTTAEVSAGEAEINLTADISEQIYIPNLERRVKMLRKRLRGSRKRLTGYIW